MLSLSLSANSCADCALSALCTNGSKKPTDPGTLADPASSKIAQRVLQPSNSRRPDLPAALCPPLVLWQMPPLGLHRVLVFPQLLSLIPSC